MVRDANTFERAVTRHSIVRTGLLRRKRRFKRSRLHPAASSADSIDRVVGLRLVRSCRHTPTSEGAP